MNFFDATAEFMVNDSGLYSFEEAKRTLYDAVDTLRAGSPFMLFGPYMMAILPDDDDVEDFYFARKVSSMAVFPKDSEVTAFAHSDGVNLPDIRDDLDDLPDL